MHAHCIAQVPGSEAGAGVRCLMIHVEGGGRTLCAGTVYCGWEGVLSGGMGA